MSKEQNKIRQSNWVLPFMFLVSYHWHGMFLRSRSKLLLEAGRGRSSLRSEALYDGFKNLLGKEAGPRRKWKL
jgi:hypothetical protein